MMNAYHFPSPPLLLLGPTLIALCTVYGTQREQREFKRRNESSQTSSEKAVYRPEQAPAKRVKERERDFTLAARLRKGEKQNLSNPLCLLSCFESSSRPMNTPSLLAREFLEARFK